MLRTGTVIRSRYKVVQAIGQGGMGAVYEAQDLVLAGRTCAIKEVRLDPEMTLEARRQAQQADQEQAKPEEQKQYNFTDPQSRIMKGSEGVVQGYNCQIAVEENFRLIVVKAATHRGSNCVPAHRASSARASSTDLGSR